MTHKDLEVWNRNINLVLEIYKMTDHLPPDEKFGLTSQIKRSSVSIPSNIASTKEFMRFIDIAAGSVSELETQLIIVQKLGFYKTDNLIENHLKIIRKMLYNLKRSLVKKL